MQATTQILAKVDTERLQKAVDGLCKGAYTIEIAYQGDREVRGFVKNGDGHEYGVMLGEHSFCGCKDYGSRKVTCKHMVALALHVIRTPRQEQPVSCNLKLGKTRREWAARSVV